MSKKDTSIEENNQQCIWDTKKRFLKQYNFPPLRRKDQAIQDDRLPPVKHTASLIFIRAKFLFLSLIEQIDKENAYSAYSLLKSYWETVSIMGYLTIKAEKLINRGKIKELIELSHRLAMGGREFPTQEMLKKRGSSRNDYIQPNLLTMMDRVDQDWNNRFKESKLKSASAFRREYDVFIAESGHPTYLGMRISIRTLKDGSMKPDITKSWTGEEKSTITNYIAFASTIFFDYWDRFQEITKM